MVVDIINSIMNSIAHFDMTDEQRKLINYDVIQIVYSFTLQRLVFTNKSDDANEFIKCFKVVYPDFEVDKRYSGLFSMTKGNLKEAFLYVMKNEKEFRCNLMTSINEDSEDLDLDDLSEDSNDSLTLSEKEIMDDIFNHTD